MNDESMWTEMLKGKGLFYSRPKCSEQSHKYCVANTIYVTRFAAVQSKRPEYEEAFTTWPALSVSIGSEPET